MSTAPQQSQGCSTTIRMYLHLNGHVFTIGQLGPDFILIDQPIDHPPADAEIVFSIDGRVRRWPVQLPDGMTAGQSETRTAHSP